MGGSWLGSVPGVSAVTFTEVTELAGITHVQHDPAQSPELRYIPMYLGGAAAADYDNDGFVDLFVTRFDNSDISLSESWQRYFSRRICRRRFYRRQ